MTSGSSDYAEVALSIWQPSTKISNEVRPLMPSARDLTDEVRRFAPGVELMPRKREGRHLVLAADPERLYTRQKFYTRVFLEYEAVEARDVDYVRRACFDAARLLGEDLARRVRMSLAMLQPPAGASVEYTSAIAEPFPMTVRFSGDAMRLLYRDDAFACFDPCSDRVAFHFASYFVVAPAGEESDGD